MKKSYLHLIEYALRLGKNISVWDGEEMQITDSTSQRDIKDAIESVDESDLVIKNSAGLVIGWARVVLEHDQRPDETVSDHTITDFMNKWDESYMSHCKHNPID